MTKAPGKSHREGISLIELSEMFPDEASAVTWFEAIQWPEGRHCPRCGSTETKEVPNAKPMPYWCKGCQSYFSVRTGTAIESSRLPLRKWAFAIYLYVTSLKGVSSMKLHRDLKVTQKTAWFMLHRLREAWGESGIDGILGPVEVDETYVGGKLKNMHADKRQEARQKPDLGKTIVAGVKDRASGAVSAQTVKYADKPTLQGFVRAHAATSATIYSDESRAYQSLPNHEAVNHGAGEYVRGQAHVNGMEAFWSMLKRGYHGTYHHWSSKHSDRYLAEFSGRHNVREADTVDQMQNIVACMVGKRLTYKELIN